MEPFSLPERIVLCAAAGGMFLAAALLVAAPALRLLQARLSGFSRKGRAARAAALALLLAATVLGGGKANDPQNRIRGGNPSLRQSPTTASTLPVWFAAAGHPGTDADGNSIPDCWEKWTHTQGFAAGSDPDGDGLTNLEEFESQTDPVRSDTDGDGIDDATECAGLAAGLSDFDPLVPATFSATEPDEDGNGVPDLWDDAGAALFCGVADDGFPFGIAVPEAEEGSFDVTISVTTTRHAALDWGCGALLLPPCSNLPIRARMKAGDGAAVSLSPAPEGAAPPAGTWKAALAVTWNPGPGMTEEGDRLLLPDGTVVDRSSRVSSVAGGWLPAPTARRTPARRAAAAGSRSGPDRPEIRFTPRRLVLESSGPFCAVHGPVPEVSIAAQTNAPPPYLWIEGGIVTESQSATYTPGWPDADGSYEVTVRWKDAHESLFVEDAIRLAPFRCRPGVTNFVGAGWTSSHDPDDPSDHEPGIEEHEVDFGPLCPSAHDATVKLGWTHDTSKLWIRNLVRIATGDPWDDETDHCIALYWEKNGTVDLRSFVSGQSAPFLGEIAFFVNGRPSGETLFFGARPRRYHPSVFHVEMQLPAVSRALDRMWIVVNHPGTGTDFDSWVSENEDLSWVENLPRPFPKLEFSTNGSGSATPVDPEPGDPGLWTKPKPTGGSFLHHDAEWEMRSYGNSEGHGNQACYDKDGNLLVSGISGGTADYSPGFWDTVAGHVENDVNPFLDAVHLDGNPGDTTLMNDVTRPCLHQGPAIDSYISRRPIVQP